MDEQATPGRGFRRTPPCVQCRLRKVKCDKQRPCESCQRSGIYCTYNDSHPGAIDVESNSELRERVAHLEAQLQSVTSNLRVKDSGTSVRPAAADESSSLPECNCGRQILGTHFSVHYDYYMNWVELFPKLRDIYFEVTAAYEDTDAPKEGPPSILGGIPRDPFALQAYQPPDVEADLLIKIYFENVNPFIRILNKEAFFADLIKFRAGHLTQSNDFNALLFSIYGLAIASLQPTHVLSSFGSEKEWLLSKYQEAQEFALRQIDFINSNKLSVFQAFLYYLVFLFARGYYQTATAMIGLAARNAQRLGLHKDPSSFNYSQWVSEWRRRLWNQLILLDEKAIVLQGATSVLGFAWDTRLPGNSNDEDWNTSPSAKPSDAPKPTVAFSQMTFVLLKREILAVLCPLRRNLRTRSYEEQMRHIAIGHKKARALFAVITDDMFPLAAFVKNIMEIEFGFLQLMAGEALIRFGESLHTFKHDHFVRALNLLERITSQESEAMNPGWMWLFRAEPPLLATAVVLSHISVVRDTEYDLRAWTQIGSIFDRYINADNSYKPPILASFQKFHDRFKSLRWQSSLGTEPTHMSDDYFVQQRNQFNYFVSGEESNAGSLDVDYQQPGLFSFDALSADPPS